MAVGREGRAVDYAAVFRLLPDPYLLLDAERRVVDVTDTALQQLHRDRETVLGAAATDVVEHPAPGAAAGPDGATLLALPRDDRSGGHRPADHGARELADALQRSLLGTPPRPEGLDIAVRYRPSGRGTLVGGDWHDAFVDEGSTTTLVVGDVTGHDGDAAAAMAQVRSVLRGIAHTGEDGPAALLSALDRTLGSMTADTVATALLAHVLPDRQTGDRVLVWSSAGHPPPLLLRPDGSARLLPGEPDLLLGVQPGWPRRDHRLRLAPGSTVALFTDGLFERRGEPLDVGLERLRRTAEAAGAQGADALCDLLLSQVEDPLPDDVALLAVTVRPPTDDGPADGARSSQERRAPSRTIVLPADPAVVRRARDLVEQMCDEAGVDSDTCHTAVLLTSETVTNAIVHGRSDATLTVSASPGLLRVEVGDEDSRRPHVAERDPHALGGRGLDIVQLLAQRWGVRDEGRGKVVWFELGEP